MKKTEIAKQLGKLAQQNGMDRLCRLDGTLQDMLSFNTPKTNVSLMKAWYAGYDAALGMPEEELQERIAKAETAGKAAFVAGKTSTPALDVNLDSLLSGCQPGEGIKVIDAWSRGWHNANLGVQP